MCKPVECPDPSQPGVGHFSSWLRPGSCREHKLETFIHLIIFVIELLKPEFLA